MTGPVEVPPLLVAAIDNLTHPCSGLVAVRCREGCHILGFQRCDAPAARVATQSCPVCGNGGSQLFCLEHTERIVAGTLLGVCTRCHLPGDPARIEWAAI